MGQPPLGATVPQQIQDGIDNLTIIVLAGSPGAPLGFFGGEKGLDLLPLRVRQVGWIRLSCWHT
jgi:hypothetical protein